MSVTEKAACYEVARTRDHTILERQIGLEYSGTLIHDGWAVYDRFTEAAHQQCVAHILRRARDLAEGATRSAARFPRQVVDLLGRALSVRDRFRSGRIGKQTMARRGLDLMDELQTLTEHRKHNAANDRLSRHLFAHLGEWFLFLFDPTVDATSNRAEQAIRPAVVNRKVWGGNRTAAGARAQSVLMSVIFNLPSKLHRRPGLPQQHPPLNKTTPRDSLDPVTKYESFSLPGCAIAGPSDGDRVFGVALYLDGVSSFNRESGGRLEARS